MRKLEYKKEEEKKEKRTRIMRKVKYKNEEEKKGIVGIEEKEQKEKE